MSNVIFKGVSGFTYKYSYMDLSPGVSWRDAPGNYAFVRIEQFVVPIYFGETVSFANRGMPPSHERWAEAVRDHGATHVLAKVTYGSESARKGEEKDLIAAYDPPLNKQHRVDVAEVMASTLSNLGIPSNSPAVDATRSLGLGLGDQRFSPSIIQNGISGLSRPSTGSGSLLNQIFAPGSRSR